MEYYAASAIYTIICFEDFCFDLNSEFEWEGLFSSFYVFFFKFL